MFDHLPDGIVWIPPEEATTPREVLEISDEVPPDEVVEIHDVDPNEVRTDYYWDLLVMAIGRVMLSHHPFAHFGGFVDPKILNGALRFYLQLQPDEHLLAIIDPSKGRRPMRGYALTTRRLYWANPIPTVVREELFLQSKEGRPPYLRSVLYEELEEIPRNGELTATSSPEPIGRLKSKWRHRHVRLATIEVLNTLIRAARNPDTRPRLTLREEDRAHRDLRAAARRTNECLATQDHLAKLPALLKAVVPRLIGVPLLILINIGFFLYMLASGVSPMMHDHMVGRSWGANFGPSTITDGQWWRLFSSMFLHFGAVHLISNMVMLWLLGRLVERMYGVRAFLALYMLAGVSGSILSVSMHPLVTSAGASGAVFGLLGSIFGYLSSRRDIAARSILQLFHPALVVYIAFDSVLGLFVPGIDGAAHVGGFAGGFIAGFLLSRPWPPPLVPEGVGRRIVGGTAMAFVLALAFIMIRPGLQANMEADPNLAKALQDSDKLIDEYNHLRETVDPLVIEYNSVDKGIREALDDIEDPPFIKLLMVARISILKNRAMNNQTRLKAISNDNAELREARDTLVSAQSHMLKVIASIETYLKNSDSKEFEGPDGIDVQLEESEKAGKMFSDQLDAFLKKYDLEQKAEVPED